MTMGMPRLICEVVEQTLCWMNPVNGFRAMRLSSQHSTSLKSNAIMEQIALKGNAIVEQIVGSSGSDRI